MFQNDNINNNSDDEMFVDFLLKLLFFRHRFSLRKMNVLFHSFSYFFFILNSLSVGGQRNLQNFFSLESLKIKSCMTTDIFYADF
jgi:hypothetical protein